MVESSRHMGRHQLSLVRGNELPKWVPGKPSTNLIRPGPLKVTWNIHGSVSSVNCVQSSSCHADFSPYKQPSGCLVHFARRLLVPLDAGLHVQHGVIGPSVNMREDWSFLVNPGGPPLGESIQQFEFLLEILDHFNFGHL